MCRLEDFIPVKHPLRSIRATFNEALLKVYRFFAGMHQADIRLRQQLATAQAVHRMGGYVHIRAKATELPL